MVEFRGQVVPVLQANLEDLLLIDFRDEDKIMESLGERVAGKGLHPTQTHLSRHMQTNKQVGLAD